MSHPIFFRFAAIAILILIWALSLSPGPDLPEFPGNDKLHHALAYFTCMFCWGQVYRRPVTRLRLALLFVGMGAMIECLQHFTQTRTFELMDIAANTVGVFVGWLVVTVQLSIERRIARGAATSLPPE